MTSPAELPARLRAPHYLGDDAKARLPEPAADLISLLRAERREAAARIEELEAALKPFAEAADSLDVVADEAAVIWGSDPMIQVRHFRRARALLTPEHPNDQH